MSAGTPILSAAAGDKRMRPLLLALVLLPSLIGVATYLVPALLINRIAGLVALALLLSLTAFRVLGGHYSIARPGIVAISASAVFLMASFLAAELNAPAPDLAMMFLARNMFLLILGFLVYSAYRDSSSAERHALMAALLAGSTLYLLLATIVVFANAGNADFDWFKFAFGVSHARHLGYHTAAHVALAAALFGLSRSSKERWIFGATLLLGFAFANLAGGRTSIVAGLAVALLCGFFADRELRARNLAIIAGLFAASIPISMVYLPPHELWGFERMFMTLEGPKGDGNVIGGRRRLWARAVEVIPAHPWIGWGDSQFKTLQEDIWTANHPHNAVLQFLVSYGIIGTAALAVLFWNAVSGALRRVFTDPSLALPPIAVIAALALVAMTDGPLFYVEPLMVFVIACAIAATMPSSGSATSAA